MSALGAFVPYDLSEQIGHHVVRKLGGIAFNLDTIWTTAIAGGLLLLLGFLARRTLTRNTTDHVPTKLQLIWETVVDQVNTQVEDNLGKVQPYVAPLAVSLFFFILFCNWLELIPTELNDKTHLLPAPTSDTNLTYAMALLVIVSTWVYGIRQKGFRGYFRHLIEPFPFLLPLNILEELLKPVTLALRLFGNIFAGSIMLVLIGGLISWQVGHVPVGGVVGLILNIIWKLFDAFIGAIQAFIFALLTVLYFGMAGAGHSDDEHGHDDEHPVAPAHDEQPNKPAAAEPTPELVS
jgi:F-type H+-transporting ATPase subunit a